MSTLLELKIDSNIKTIENCQRVIFISTIVDECSSRIISLEELNNCFIFVNFKSKCPTNTSVFYIKSVQPCFNNIEICILKSDEKTSIIYMLSS